MRALLVVALVLITPVLLMPFARADVTPVPVWPAPELLNRDAAHDLTTWFATSLGVQIDTGKPGEWYSVGQSDRPEGFRAYDMYRLPLVGGQVEAQYLRTGILKNIYMEAETQYIAQSENESHLRIVADQIASDIDLDTGGLQSGTIIVEMYPGTFQDESLWEVSLENQSDLGVPYDFNTLSVGIRMGDLRVVYVSASVWYEMTGEPPLANDNHGFGENLAMTEYGAVNATSNYLAVGVWNGTEYVFLVHTTWGVETGETYEMDEWIDVNTGDVLHRDGPTLTVDESGIVFGVWPWAAVIVATVAIFIAMGVFYRISSERALDHFTRGRILGYLESNPGASYSIIRKNLGLTNGTAAYHLWVLERLGFIRSVRTGRVKQFYPQGVSLSKGSLILTRLQFSILDLLEAEGALSQSEIAKSMDMSRQRAHYNVKVLKSMSLVQEVNGGKVELTYEGEEAIAEGEDGLFVTTESGPSSEPN